MAGVSFDPPADNLAFARAEGFPFPLLSDAERMTSAAYGATRGPGEELPPWGTDVPRRRSVLVGPDGRVRRIYDVRDAAAHAEQVLHDAMAASRR